MADSKAGHPDHPASKKRLSTIQDNVRSFFVLVGTGGTQNITSIQKLFVPDNPQPPGPANIGLTTAGPQFQGQAGIHDLFTTLQNTFSIYALDCAPDPNPNNAQLMVGNNLVAVEAMLTTGYLKKSWSPSTVTPSPPLSKIKPNNTQPTSYLPVSAVFTMDAGASNLITNLALYFDRWKLGQDKWDKTHPSHIDK